jgi:methylglyoxal synthase
MLIMALIRIDVLYNVPMACNSYTVDFIVSSVYFREYYQPEIKDYSGYLNQEII